MKTIHKSAKLANVCYDIRGPIMDAARQMEEEGHKIIKLNIGNLAVFGFDSPEEIQQDMIRNLPNSAGYSDSKGIFAARKAVMHETQKQGIRGVTLDDIYLGNGASELIVMATNALLDNGDELLLPSPDYPLWTAAASLVGRYAGALFVRRGQWLDAGFGRYPLQGHPAYQGHRRHQPQQPYGGAVFRRIAAGHRGPCARAWPGDFCRRGLRQGALRRRAPHADCFAQRRRADADLQFALQKLPVLRLPRWLGGHFRRQEARQRLYRGPEHALEHAAVLQRAGPVGHSNGAGRPPKHQRAGGRGRAPAPPARPGATS
jgi:hypothetical protein